MTGTVPNGTKRRYSYQYDGLNRLLRGYIHSRDHQLPVMITIMRSSAMI
ncbi:MAG: hypothetical protein ACOVRK_03615 [Chryseobacterium taeanense]